MRANRVQATVCRMGRRGLTDQILVFAAGMKIGGLEQCHPKTACLKKAVRLSTLYVNKRGKQKTIQTIHKTLHKPYIPLIFRALRNV